MKLIVLDRDGVINEDSDAYIKSPAEWIPIPGSADAIAQLNQQGYTVVVATNQSGLQRGLFSEATLARIHEKMTDHIHAAGGHLAGIFYCPHGPDDQCDCRKPNPGLLDQIARQFNTSLSGCYLVGDSLRDLQAGLAHQCKPVLVLTGKGQGTLDKGLPVELADTPVYKDLMAFVSDLTS